MMCRHLGVARSSFYAWRTRQPRPPSPRQRRHAQLTEAVRRRFQAAQGRVGRRPMRYLLAQDGIACSPGTIHRIMAELDFQAARHRAWRPTTRRHPQARTAHIANHCLDATGRRDFSSARPGTRLVGDITGIPTRAGWHYLAVVLDLATRAVVGWALRPHPQADLATAALRMAQQQGALEPGAIFHSDRGVQYTSQGFQDFCRQQQVTQSMGAVGTCWDNAVAESFFATLKGDLKSEVGVFATASAVRRWIVTYIEGWYNRERPHTYTQGRPPMVAWTARQSPSAAVHDS